MSPKTILVWFRNDLRIHDNEILLEAINKAERVLPVYCFDDRQFRETATGSRKTGVKRARFLLESVADLKQTLQKAGGDLLVVQGHPEIVLPEIARKYEIAEVYHHREVAHEETHISTLVEDALWKLHINLKHFIGHTMYHKEDLPFPIKDIPDVFATFKKKVERDSEIRPCFATPQHIPLPDNVEESALPSLSDLGYPETADDNAALFIGGEHEGLKHLHELFIQPQLSKKVTSNLSPWLALGCLSIRQVYWVMKEYISNPDYGGFASQVILELLWRDYYRFMFKKHGNKFFRETGFTGKPLTFAENQELQFEKWKTGHTGMPFIDAVMRELNATGYVSFTGRTAVASYLIKNLAVNWTWGAAYFEEKLIDYSPASNWGNWAAIAGVGNNPKENRDINLQKEALNYDPKGDYVRKWVPELACIPGAQVHQPWLLSETETENYGIGNTIYDAVISNLQTAT
ncbi:DASH family cryptochrome [Pedobacter sp. BS3]|nr:DASH family cryptochrome [Pedobacter sp. BS3]